jgi:hypothetical protein
MVVIILKGEVDEEAFGSVDHLGWGQLSHPTGSDDLWLSRRHIIVLPLIGLLLCLTLLGLC